MNEHKGDKKAVDTMFRKIVRRSNKGYYSHSRMGLKYVEVKNGTAHCTDGMTAVRVNGYYGSMLYNPIDENSLPINAHDYPDLSKFFTGYTDEDKVFRFPTERLYNELKKMYDSQDKDSKNNVIRLVVKGNKIYPSMEVTTDTGLSRIEGGCCNINTTIREEFFIHLDYRRIRDVLLMYKQLGVRDIDIHYMHEYRPLLFKAKNVDVILAPIRTK